jgi:2-dehydropantoate 2-reductase
MKIAVVGAGGVGGYFGGLLARGGHEVRLFARGEHLDAIRARGLEIREPDATWTVHPTASDDPADLLPAEFAIVAVKSYSLSEVTPVVRRLASAGATIVPLLNGVESFETLVAAGVAAERILGGLAVVSAEKSAPGVITRRSEFRKIVVGEKPGGPSVRGESLAAALRGAGADASVSENITVDLWRKFLFLSTFAATCGLARATVGAVRAAAYGPLLVERALRETAAVARARGVALGDDEEKKILLQMAALAPGLKPSFLLDLERGGPNELDVLSGAIARFGRESGVPTPIHDTAVTALSAGRETETRQADAGRAPAHLEIASPETASPARLPISLSEEREVPGGVLEPALALAFSTDSPLALPIARVQAQARTRVVIPKHHALVRLSHWLNVPILLAMIASGLSIYWASPVFDHAPRAATGSREYLADVGIWVAHHFPALAGKGPPAAWVYDHFGIGVYRLAQALRLHWLFAYLFMANGAVYFLGLLLGGGYRALLPRASDLRDALRMMRYYVGVVPAKILRRPWPHPPSTSKYNALQRGAYFSMPILGALAVASGWAMHKPAQLGWLERLFVNYNGARIVHFSVMVLLAAFVIPHVILVAVDGWDTFRSMIVGWSERIADPHEKD